MIAEIKRLRENISFDRLPDCRYAPSDLDLELARKLFKAVGKTFLPSTEQSLGLVAQYQSEFYPTKGGLLLFGKNRDQIFPSPLVQLLRFDGKTKGPVMDHLEINTPLPLAFNEIRNFIRRNTKVGVNVENIIRQEVPEYPTVAVREAVINMLVHADYSTMNSVPQVSIFDDRIEFTNPGSLPFGLKLETALSGVSQLRNKVLGKVFKELRLSEIGGSGLNSIIQSCRKEETPPPKFEELGYFFRVTLYPKRGSKKKEV